MAASSNSLRFGVNLTGAGRPYDELLATARVAEEAGFDTIALTDRPPEQNFEAWTLASAIGVLTTRVRITHNTLNVPFRNAALLAKMSGSLEAIIGPDRLYLTLGAGGQPTHFESYGIAYGTPGERFTDLRDAVSIVRGLWANERFSYAGRIQQVVDASAPPRPAAGTMPIYIGALGPRMMAYTGRAADGWLKNRGWPESVDQLRDLVAQLEAGAAAAGRDPSTIRRVLNGAAAIGPNVVAAAGAGPGWGAGLLGSADDILATIKTYQAAGADTFHLAFAADDRHAQMRAFGSEVIARVRTW
jgi:alkanesulfonate monooxygenase SsuD/methylene tetrahydromethanopterin reductase-like flavin-dependent oxidoreductase (luciferase family)